MSKIFILHVKEDEEFATRLAEQLRKSGYKVLEPTSDIMLGYPSSEIVEGLIRKSHVVLFLFSESSMRDRSFYGGVGYTVGYCSISRKPKVLPVLLDKVNLPFDLAQTFRVETIGRPEAEVYLMIEEAIGRILGRWKAFSIKRAEIQTRVENTAQAYIKDSLLELTKREKRDRRISYALYVLSYLTVVGGIPLVATKLLIQPAVHIDWPRLLHQTFLLSVVLGFLVAAAKFSFALAKSFMVESLRNANRIHAIKFGEFYLKAFGDETQWREIKEAFGQWNIDSGSDFIKQDVQAIDPEIYKKFLDLLSVIKKS